MTPKRRSARKVPPTIDPETYLAGTWSGLANYRCPFCPFATLEGTALVVAHLAAVHRDQLSEAPKEE